MAKYSNVDVSGFTTSKAERVYPNIEVRDINPTFALVYTLLEAGDMPLIARYNGEEKLICRISQSAINVGKLLSTQQGIVYNPDENTSIPITKIEDYLGVFSWT